MIYTLTLNPSIDYHIHLPQLSEGTINPVQKEWKTAGGKGINVSKVLKNLGMESTALGFVGGFTGHFIQKQIENLKIPHQFIAVEEDSRMNIKIKSTMETEVTGVSPFIPDTAVKQLYSQLDKLSEGDYLVLAGSVPESIPADIYQSIFKRLQLKKVRIFLDSKGDALMKSLPMRPFLIKPNHKELGDLFGVSIRSAEEAIEYGQKAVDLGAEHVIVSMAGEGAVFVSQQEVIVASIPSREPVNSIGAGDSMVAGFLYYFANTGVIDEGFRFAVAAGSTTALSEGFCTPEKIEQYLPEITIKKRS